MPQGSVSERINVFARVCIGVWLCAFVLAVPMALAAPATPETHAPAWPNKKPIRLIVPFAPEGATDMCARILAKHLEKRLHQKVRVVNMSSPTGTRGFSELADAEPDGYTIGFINTPHFISAQVQGDASYTFESFVPVAGLMDDPVAILVRKDSPFTSLQAVVDYARENPAALVCGTSGIGSDDHITEVLMNRITNTRVRHKPLDGTATVRRQLMDGRVDIGLFNVGEALPNVRSGELRCLGQASDLRSSQLPDVPTLAEQGYDVVMSSMRGLAMPVNTPQQIVDELVEHIKETVTSEAFLKEYAETSLPLYYAGPREFGDRLLLVKVMVEKIWSTQPWIEEERARQ